MATDAAVDADRRRVEQPPRGGGVVPQAAIEDREIVTGWPSGEEPRPPRKPGRRPAHAGAVAHHSGERVVLDEPLEEGESEQVALPFIDGHGEVIVERVAERMADQKATAAVHA